ncbi:MAG TPA: pyrroline-5-carboxylate reductase [Burkholderiaceae bacterium]|nr:pyrroline-5-carboxylate reductase [Burkholderiaceae bacterium]
MKGAQRVGFIGGGNMAGALIGGLLQAGTPPHDLFALEIDPARRAQLEKHFGIATAAGADDRLQAQDALVLAVKPQQMKELCAALAPRIGNKLVVSIAAGIRARDIARWLGTQAIVRAMPNTPALIGQGVTGLAALPAVDASQRAAAERILAAVGSVVWFDDEKALDAVTALSGSGPAYVFYFIEAMIAAGRAEGLTERQARTLATATLAGAAQLAARSDEPVAVLRERVTSKGGTTAAALASLDADRVGAAIAKAIHAASARAQELGDEFGRG